MVLSQTEIELAQQMMNSVHNVSSQGYEIAVRGTVISGLSDLVMVLLGIIVTIIFIKQYLKWIPNQDDLSESGAFCWGVVFSLAVFLVSAIGFNVIFHGILMSVFAPEYVVITKVLESAASMAI